MLVIAYNPRKTVAGLILVVATLFTPDFTNGAEPGLLAAAKNNDAQTMGRLLAAGSDPDTRQADGATALHWAVHRDNSVMLDALIAAGADINATNRLGASALFIAAGNGNAPLIKRLLDAGADPNLPLTMGETPLMTASRSGTAEGVGYLVQAGADPNASEHSRDQTALMWAAAQGHAGVVRILIEAGANLEARSKVRPMLMFTDATNGGAFDQGVMESLGGYTPLLFAARQGHVEIARLLIDAGARIDSAAGNGTSPLVVATHSGHTRLARFLLELGADPNQIGAGYTALHAAVLRGDYDVVVALLDAGADPDARLEKATPIQRASEDWKFSNSHVSATPYWLAASFREAKIMDVLVQAGADPRLSNQELWSRPRERADRSESWTREVVGGFESPLQAAIRGNSDRDRYYLIANTDPVGEEELALAAVIAAAEHGVDLNHRDYTESTALHDAASRNLPSVVRALLERGAEVNSLNRSGLTSLDLGIASAGRTLFYAPDQPVTPGPTVVEILREFGAVRSNR